MAVQAPEPALSGERRWVWEEYADFVEHRSTASFLGELDELPPEEKHWDFWLETSAFAFLERGLALMSHKLDPTGSSTAAYNEAGDRMVQWLVDVFHLPHVGTGEPGPDDIHEWSDWYEKRAKANRSMRYEWYLQSDDWKAARKSAHRRAGGKCQACNSDKALEVHHRTYERRGEELASDLLVLCRRCHQAVHFHGGAHSPGRKKVEGKGA
jgi:hypothetical protein